MTPPPTTPAPPARRWWPDTLLGRLMAVLVLGLVGALSLSTWISLSEREDVLRRTAGLQPAERLADLVALLDPLSTAERERLVRVLDSPVLRVTLTPQPTPLPTLRDEDLARHPRAARALSLYTTALRNALGDARGLTVQLLPPPRSRGELPEWRTPRAESEPHREARDDDAGRSARRRTRHAAEPIFVAQVQLADGAWLRLDTGLPREPELPARMLASLAVLLLAALGLSWWAVRRITHPLRQLADAADALGRDLSRPPLPESGAREVRSAQQAFNTMQARLRHLIETRTHLLAAVSHDLKTPLTRMRLRAELLDDEALRAPLLRDLDEMTQMVNDTLDFLRGLNQPEAPQSVDLNALLARLQADQQAMGRTVTLSGLAHSPWTGDSVRLQRCLGNLVDNAVLYGHQAAITLSDEGRAIEVRVRDAGPGIPEASLEQVFEPFFRLEASRNRHTGGSGLGLGIARHIAEAGGGSLSLRNHPEGGLEAVVTLRRPPD